MRRAAFLDRDGTLIELVHHLTDPADVRLISGGAESVFRLRAAGFLVVIVTNQSVIGRGKLTDAGLAEVHAEMNRQLSQENTKVDGMYYCPLAPVAKDPTKIEDPMRKPGPGMLLQAATDLNIDLAQSYMVGDTVSDMLAGRNAGCQTILVETGYGSDYKFDKDAVDHSASHLSAAADYILSHQELL